MISINAIAFLFHLEKKKKANTFYIVYNIFNDVLHFELIV